MANAHLNLAFSYLILGNFEQGWEKYESRRQIQQLELHKPKFTQPHWFGIESLKNKTILLYSEQGLGDTIQFCRYVTILSDLGAKVILQVQKPLARLLTNLSGVSQLIVEGSPLPEFDYHYPLLSLPLAFKTNLTNMPAAPHYLAADATQLKKWQTRLGPKIKPRIGIVWSGNESPKNRSIPLIDFVRVLSDEFQFVSLQKEVREVDRQLLQSRHDILHFGNEFLDFADTAALCELVDIVVSIDTSVAHLAGAMGKAIWILLPFKPDWRWFLDRNDNPWYPSAKLYRQKEFGNWGDVLSQVQSDLPQFVCNGCDSNNIEEIAAKPTFPHDSGDK